MIDQSQSESVMAYLSYARVPFDRSIAFILPLLLRAPTPLLPFQLGICESLVALSSFVNQYTSHSRCICNASRVEHFNQIYLFYFEVYISCPMQHRTYIQATGLFFLALPAYFTFFYESSFSHACPIDRCSSTRLEPFIVRIKCTQAPRRRAVENSTRTQKEEVDPDD